MMEKFELRFWDVVTPVLSATSVRVYRLRHAILSRENTLPAWLTRLARMKRQEVTQTMLYSGTAGLLCGALCYVILYAAVRF